MNATAPMRAFEVPAPYRLISGFMGNDLVERLLAFADVNQEAFVLTTVGTASCPSPPVPIWRRWACRWAKRCPCGRPA